MIEDDIRDLRASEAAAARLLRRHLGAQRGSAALAVAAESACEECASNWCP